MINLIIKGNMFDAFNAAHARGIALLTAAQLFDDRSERLRCEVVASCADTSIDAVRTWYLASDGPAPYPAGALLFYSDKRSAAFNDERAAPPCCQFHASGGQRALSCGGDTALRHVPGRALGLIDF
jgi:hypothetical protein